MGQRTEVNRPIPPPGRSWGVFTIKVPSDFKEELSWTLVANDQLVTVPSHFRPAYFVEPFKDQSNNNQPPVISFSADGAPFTGPPVEIVHSFSTSVATTTDLLTWLSDIPPDRNVRKNPRRRRPPLVLQWHKFRGPGEVNFEDHVKEFGEAVDQNPTTPITFNEAAEYWLPAKVLNSTGDGGGGFQRY